MHRALLLALGLAVSVSPACKGDASGDSKDGATKSAKKPNDPPPTTAANAEGSTTGGEPAADTGTTGGAAAADTTDSTAGDTTDSTGGDTTDSTGDDTTDSTGGDTTGGTEEEQNAAKIKALLDEATSTGKTKNDRAMAAFEEAKGLGAEPRDIAVAAKKRGVKLLSKGVDQATKFFEYARTVDESYPDATFELAKIAVNAGEIETTIELLTEVKARKGKKLLKNIPFDPMFALVADDPAVRKLLK